MRPLLIGNAMFKKRIVADISLAKSPKDEGDLDTEIAEGIAESAANIINGVVEDLVKPVAITIVGSIVTVTVVKAVCTIAVKATKTR